MRIALLSAAVEGDNSGDALIEDAIRRILIADEFIRFPLLRTLSKAEIKAINGADCAIICGTNLYQNVFACNLGWAAINAIKIPLVPMGVGCSAEINCLPRMKWWYRHLVRLVHSKCAVGSVRDPASLRFLNSIGVKNAKLTGCPVLFHGLCAPNFDGTGDGITLSIRFRILHAKGTAGWDREVATLEQVCRKYSPRLIAQSPYDLEIGEKLCRQYGLEMTCDREWQAPPYVEIARSQRATLGFRLHYGMLSLSYGKPAYFIAHDSRIASFCDMVGIRYFDIRDYEDDDIFAALDSLRFDGDAFRRRWQELAQTMIECLRENGLSSRIRPQ